MKGKSLTLWGILCILGFAVSLPAGALDFTGGRLKLVLHENTGRFSLYYLSDITRERYTPLFVDQDPRTSFLTVMVNDRTYRMGEASAFRTRIEGAPANPAIIFDSSFLAVTQEFSFIKTAGSSLTNGIRMHIRVLNRGERQAWVGLRFLLDTSLGEESSPAPFSTDQRSLNAETVIEKTAPDRYWISRSDHVSLMGSISTGVTAPPDLVHFANWKRFNDTPWKIQYTPGRNFNNLPYSVGDSAVCYYFEPLPLARGESRDFDILLAAEAEGGFAAPGKAVENEVSRILADSEALLSREEDRQDDAAVIRNLLARIDGYLSSGVFVSDEELSAIEMVIARLKTRYSIP
jgi:hypothetical protein